jgi:hypothetical protein
MSNVVEIAYVTSARLTIYLGMLAILATGGYAHASAVEPSEPQETAVAIPSARYDVAGIHNFMVGYDYRDLWATPIEVPVLDLETFAGGLTPTSRGGGQQTLGLRFIGADGRPYSFRGLDKSPLAILPESVHSTFIGTAVQDQTHAAFPTGYVVVPPLMDALGVLNAHPIIIILPDSPLLGEHRESFAGQIGTIEEWPNEGPNGSPGFAGATDVVSTDQLDERLLADGSQRVATEEYLTARLLDVMIGDWDRHRGQWRWANIGPGEPPMWRPIPEDRDQAFVRYSGVMIDIARNTAPQLTKFEKDYASPQGPTWNGRDMDRRFLVGLGRAVWDSVTASVQTRLTDEVIVAAVGRLPDSHHDLRGDFLIETLIWRRDHLHEFAREFYLFLAGEVDVHGSDTSEVWQVEWLGEEGLRLTVTAADSAHAPQAPRIERQFSAAETHDVRLYLNGGDDVVGVRGNRDCDIDLRIICSAGGDRVDVDKDPGGIHVYDPRTSNPVHAGDLKVHTKPWQVPGHPSGSSAESEADPAMLVAPYRDWGSTVSMLPVLDLNSDLGLVLGASLTKNRYGFRYHPFRNRYNASLAYSVGKNRFRMRAGFRKGFVNSSSWLTFDTTFSAIEYLNYFGFGNNTARVFDEDIYATDAFLIEFLFGYAWERGPLALRCQWRFVAHKDHEGQQTLLALEQPYGYGTFRHTGLVSGLDFDTRDNGAYATRGTRIRVDGAWYPKAFDASQGAFGYLNATGSGYLRIYDHLIGAARIGGRKLWGEYPYFEAATVGGGDTVRGYAQRRFAGDASVYANVELRRKLFSEFLLLPGELGAFLLGDAGRVFVNGESPGGWHSSWGFGLWAAKVNRLTTLSVALAFGDEGTSFYLNFGMEY